MKTFIFCLSQIILFILFNPCNCKFYICKKYYTTFLEGTKATECEFQPITPILSNETSVTEVRFIESPVFGPINSSKIDSLRIKGVRMSFVPTGLEKFFPNLLYLMINSCQLPKVSQSDLKPFPKIKILWMQMNYIQILEKNLFEFNLELTAIDFRLNIITIIDPTIFDNLKHLHSIFLDQNSCISTTGGGPVGIARIIKHVKQHCQGHSTTESFGIVRQDDNNKYGKFIWIIIGCGVAVVASAFIQIIYKICVALRSRKISQEQGTDEVNEIKTCSVDEDESNKI